MKNSIAIIIVLYNPTLDNIRRIYSLIQSGNFLYVLVDNTPNSKLDLDVSENLVYLPLYSNNGIARAQNIGIKYVLDNTNIQYLLFVDQDSYLNENFVSAMCSAYLKLRENFCNIAALGPCIINSRNMEYAKKSFVAAISDDIQQVSVLISSGMFCHREIFDKVGLMNEQMFIDYVDFEWCWRANSLGYNNYQSMKICLEHSVGENDHTILGYSYILSSPIRYFYQYRNFMWLLKKKYVPINWKIKNFIKKMFFMFYIPISQLDKRYWIFMIKGIKAAMKKNL